MRTSPSDTREYQFQQLSNGLRAILVCDPHSSKSAASLAVNVGHFDDPPYRQGLAHFLEHMLFLGTEKYPHPGEYQQFITHHGGNHNAWTGTEFTNYFFDIETDWFESALDQFSQFFIAPLFDAELINKERQAVHSEYQLKIQDDVRRLYQVHKETVNPLHPFSKFSVGSAETLADWPNQPVRQDLIHFYQQSYSADKMTLVLVSPLPIASQQFLLSFFEAIKTIPHQEPSDPEVPLLTDKERAILIYARPIKEVRRLTLAFDFADQQCHYRNKPLTFLAHLLGNETSGGLIAHLRQEGFIQTMAAGGGISGKGFREFTLSYQLTEEGLSAIDHIIEASFSYLQLIRNQGLEAWRYQEKQCILQRAFNYQERIRSIDLASHLAINMHHYTPEDVIQGDYLMESFDKSELIACLDQMVPQRLRITLLDKEVETNRLAQWYQTPYRVEPITPEQLLRWETPRDLQLLLPPVNPFISDEPHQIFSDDTSDKPRVLCDKLGYRFWFQQDSEFQIPKGHIYLGIDTFNAVSSIEHIAYSRLAIECLIDHLSELTYQAEIAGMSYQIYTHQGGYTLHTAGISHRQFELLKMILNERSFGHFDPQRFEHVKHQLLEYWHNQTHIKPINRLYQQLISLLQPKNPIPEQLIQALKPVTVQQMPDFVSGLYQKVHIESFIYGNWSTQQAFAMSDYLQREVAPQSQSGEETPRELIDISGQQTLTYELATEHNDSAILVYFQSAENKPEQIALYTFCNHLMSSTFFYELRTQQQLGYIVGNGNLPLNRHPGIIFYIQSPHATPTQMLDAIDRFLDHFPVLVFELSEQQWNEAKQGLATQILELESNMRVRAQYYWTSIGNKDTSFNQRQLVVEALMKLDRAELMRFTMALKNHHRDRLVLYSTGLSHQKEHHLEVGHPINDRSRFQQLSRRFRY
ncbi:insulinase family protein [Celerinatantimonas sp. YJH-8]|uniref:insulinase family protein n=1 Tax=Celerinatantimonas sp. YJH-8 TaxID=3228714 RepID=UPI0038C334E4